MKPQLLCTFAHKTDLDLVLDYITSTLPCEDCIFVFTDTNDVDDLYITFNILRPLTRNIQNTILIHRKKETNTLYTVNALNTLIRKCNNGVLDTSFQINWIQYRNSLLLTKNNDIRHIHLQLFKKIAV